MELSNFEEIKESLLNAQKLLSSESPCLLWVKAEQYNPNNGTIDHKITYYYFLRESSKAINNFIKKRDELYVKAKEGKYWVIDNNSTLAFFCSNEFSAVACEVSIGIGDALSVQA